MLLAAFFASICETPSTYPPPAPPPLRFLAGSCDEAVTKYYVNNTFYEDIPPRPTPKIPPLTCGKFVAPLAYYKGASLLVPGGAQYLSMSAFACARLRGRGTTSLVRCGVSAAAPQLYPRLLVLAGLGVAYIQWQDVLWSRLTCILCCYLLPVYQVSTIHVYCYFFCCQPPLPIIIFIKNS